MRIGLRAIAVCAVVALAGCTPAAGGPILTDYGHSFGFCVGFCDGRVHIAGSTLTLTLTDHRSGAVVTHTGSLASDALDRLTSAEASIDASSLLPVNGCPDCADGGASFLTLHTMSGDVATRYEAGNPPTVLAALDQVGSELLGALRSCQSTALVTIVGPCIAA